MGCRLLFVASDAQCAGAAGDACVGKTAVSQLFYSGGATYPKTYMMVRGVGRGGLPQPCFGEWIFQTLSSPPRQAQSSGTLVTRCNCVHGTSIYRLWAQI